MLDAEHNMRRRAFLATITGAFAALNLPKSIALESAKTATVPNGSEFYLPYPYPSLDGIMAAESKRIAGTINRTISKRSPFLDLL
jgi:hypothetical protein